MMATILNSAILDSVMLHKTLTQSNSIWLKLIHSDSNWWWQPSWILLSWIQPFCTKKFTCSFWLNLMMGAILNSAMLDSDTAILDSNTLLSSLSFTQKHSPSTLTLTQTNSIWLTRWWQPSWILPSWIQSCCTKLWLNLIQSDSNTFILNQLDDGSHLEFCHLGFSHLHKKNFTHAFWLNLMMEAILKSAILDSAICTKKNFTHAFSLTLLMATILDSAILDSAILHKNLTQTSSIWLKLIHSHSTWWYQSSWILPSWIQYTSILDSNTLLSSLRFTQKHSSSTLTLTQTNSIWLTYWWQPSSILPSWILPSWIHPFCTKLWLKLVQSDSNSFILT